MTVAVGDQEITDLLVKKIKNYLEWVLIFLQNTLKTY